MRPVWWPDGRPAGGDGQDDTFLLGDALLVAPATAPGQTRRAVHLPEGAWHPWWAADDRRALGRRTEAPCPPGRIPMFARAGSIVPLDDGFADPAGPSALHDDPVEPAAGGDGAVPPGHAPRLLAFHCWPLEGGAAGANVDDAGDGDGPTRDDVLELTGAVSGGSATMRWERRGDFAAPERVRVVLHGLRAEAAAVDGAPVEVRGSVVECPPFEELRLQGLRSV